LVTEVDTGFQHFTHCYGHLILQGWVWNPVSHHSGTLCDRTRDLTLIYDYFYHVARKPIQATRDSNLIRALFQEKQASALSGGMRGASGV
jgi:hypothetical protein